MATYRKYTAEFKRAVVERMSESRGRIRALSEELGIARTLLYRWQAQYAREGMSGLERSVGRQRRRERALSPAREMALLHQKIGEQQVMIDFLAAACKRVEALRSASDAPGAKASTPQSKA